LNILYYVNFVLYHFFTIKIYALTLQVLNIIYGKIFSVAICVWASLGQFIS